MGGDCDWFLDEVFCMGDRRSRIRSVDRKAQCKNECCNKQHGAKEFDPVHRTCLRSSKDLKR